MSFFARYVSEKRQVLGITQKELADRLHIHWSIIANIEQGRPPPTHHFKAMADVFMVPLDALLDIYLSDCKDRAMRKIDLKHM